MELNRFSLALYIVYPTMASYCSIIMLAQFIQFLNGNVDAGGLYGDMYTYLEMSSNLSFTAGEPEQLRPIVPALAGGLAHLIGATSQETLVLIFGAFNFAMLLTGLGLLLKIAMTNQTIGTLRVAAPVFLIITIPAYVQGGMLPVPEAGAFLFFTLMVTSIYFRRLTYLFLSAIPAVWFTEITLAAVLVVALLNWMRNDHWWQAYLPFLLSALIYVTVSSMAGYDPLSRWLDAFATFHAADLFTGWTALTQLLLGLGFIVPYIIYQHIKHGLQKLYVALTLMLVACFILFSIVEPRLVPRYLFIISPMIVFFVFSDQSLRMLPATAGFRPSPSG